MITQFISTLISFGDRSTERNMQNLRQMIKHTSIFVLSMEICEPSYGTNLYQNIKT